jgi:hypothetical protein
MKKIDVVLKEKITNLIFNYKKYMITNDWLVRFTTEPLKVLVAIEDGDTVLFEKLESVNKGIVNETLKTKAIEIGLKVISGYGNDIYKDIVDSIDFITNKENNPLNVIAENTELIYKDVNSDQLVRFVTGMNSSLAMKEYTASKAESIFSPIITTDVGTNVAYDVWLNRLVLTINSLPLTLPSQTLSNLKGLEQLDVYVDKKVKLIKDNLKEETLVVDAPVGNINLHTEILREDLEIEFSRLVTSDTDESIKPTVAIEKLVNSLLSSITDFETIVIGKDKVMLNKTILLKNVKLIKKYSDDFVKGEELAMDFNRILLEIHNINTIVIERIEKFISELINESIKLNYNANTFMHLNILLEKILIEAVIK